MCIYIMRASINKLKSSDFLISCINGNSPHPSRFSILYIIKASIFRFQSTSRKQNTLHHSVITSLKEKYKTTQSLPPLLSYFHGQ
mmetsp:Transcript_47459/g.70276  ORF Transcript_47459/g.70276 Transcript_47459/m.70276 type:complete len:85 (-) Transcript_47459:493-747(-)